MRNEPCLAPSQAAPNPIARITVYGLFGLSALLIFGGGLYAKLDPSLGLPLTWALIIGPWLCLLLAIVIPDVPKVESEFRKSRRLTPEPLVYGPIALIALGLAMVADRAINVISWQAFWLPFFVLVPVMFLLMFFIIPFIRKHWIMYLALIFISVVYSFGATVTVNSLTDTSHPTVYHATIKSGVHEWDRTGDSYTLTLTPWGTRHLDGDVKVISQVFDRCAVGDNVTIKVYRGSLNIPWFQVDK